MDVTITGTDFIGGETTVVLSGPTKAEIEATTVVVDDGFTGASYEWTDDDAGHATARWYKLEAVDLYGGSAYYGPVSAQGTVPALGCGIAEGGSGGLLLLLSVAGALAVVRTRRRRIR